MRSIEYPEVLKLSKEELVAFQLNYILRKMKLNETQLRVLAYVYLYGHDTADRLYREGFTKSARSVYNSISDFRKLKLVVGKGEETRLHPNIKVYLEDLSYTIKLELHDRLDS